MLHGSLWAEALDRLAAHAWPGNIRKLCNVLEQAALMTDAAMLLTGDVAATLGSELQAAPLPAPAPSLSALADAGAGASSALPPPTPATPAVADIRPLAEAVSELE